jgi:alanine dehydrogenase
MVLLFRPETGEPLVVMDGLSLKCVPAQCRQLPPMRLARQESTALAILGSGVQARSHLHALRLVRHFRETRICFDTHHAAG